jgi:electron transfer flavoprotein alpha subunit
MATYPAASILVLLETTPDGGFSRFNAGLLGAASQIGRPVALLVAEPPHVDALASAAADAGATAVLVADADPNVLTRPRLEALQAAANTVNPVAVLISNSVEGRGGVGLCHGPICRSHALGARGRRHRRLAR